MKKCETSGVCGSAEAILRRLGVPEHLTGYAYLREAVELVSCDPSILRNMTKRLYPAVAEKFSTTPAASERAMRFAVESAWLRCDPEVQLSYFGNTISPQKGKPSNSEFIARVTSAVNQEVLS